MSCFQVGFGIALTSVQSGALFKFDYALHVPRSHINGFNAYRSNFLTTGSKKIDSFDHRSSILTLLSIVLTLVLKKIDSFDHRSSILTLLSIVLTLV